MRVSRFVSQAGASTAAPVESMPEDNYYQPVKVLKE
jgi:hypothetical protein